MKKPFRKVMVLGMDGLDPRRIDALLDAGKLPAFARLRKRGTLRPLATSNPAESPVAWSSLASGCNPGKHGIFDFIHRDPAGCVPFLSIVRRCQSRGIGSPKAYVAPRRRPGFWRHVSDAGIPTTVVRWPVTFPAERVNGNFLAGLGVPDVTGRLGKHILYTTETGAGDDEKVVRLQRRGGRFETWLEGPQIGGWRSTRPLRAKLSIDCTDRGVRIRLGPQRETLRPGQWSGWFSVSFRWGPIPVCHGIVRFHLVRREPRLKLFATPVQLDPARPRWPLTEPRAYGAELTEEIGLFYTLGLPEDTHAVTDGHYDLDVFLQQCDDVSRERRRMFEYELNRFREGLLAFVFDAGDRIQHMFWSIGDRAGPAYDANRADRYKSVVDDLYREMDGVLSDALRVADDETAVFVVSDHGFGPFRRAVHLNRWLIDRGYMKLKDTPEGRSLFADVDWRQTRAYALGFTSIYLNRRGRESGGIVCEDESASLRQEIAVRLPTLTDSAGERRVVRRVYAASEIYSGPFVHEGPDLIVGFEPGYRASWQTALGAAPAEQIVDNHSLWSADHLVDPSAVPGVLASNLALNVTGAMGVDLAPTILECFGLAANASMDGRSWLGRKTLRERQNACIPSDDAQPEFAGAGVGADGLNDDQRRQIEQHLGDLGYL